MTFVATLIIVGVACGTSARRLRPCAGFHCGGEHRGLRGDLFLECRDEIVLRLGQDQGRSEEFESQRRDLWLMLLLCCNLLSLAEGGSTTVVAWGVHLPSGCHCCVIVRHHTPHIRHRNGRRNTQKSETIAEVHGNSARHLPSFLGSLVSTLKRIYPHQPLQTPLRCTTLRAALLVFSSFTSSSRSAAALRLPRSLLLPLATRSR